MSVASFYRRWDAWPLWAKCASAIGAFYVVIAMFRAWNEPRPVGGAAEEFFAMLIRDGAIFGGLAGAVVLGMAVAKNVPDKQWLGWLIGIIALGVAWSIPHFAESIPGVGWRIEQMNNSEASDYY